MARRLALDESFRAIGRRLGRAQSPVLNDLISLATSSCQFVVTERGARILRLGSGSVGIFNPNTNNGGSVRMERFPIQGLCFYGDTRGTLRAGDSTATRASPPEKPGRAR